MLTLRQYRNPLLAEEAAQFLRSHSVDARTASRTGGSGITGATEGLYELVLMNSIDRARAENLLEQLRDVPAYSSHDELDSQALPDLSKLEARFLPACPGCAARLSVACKVCPACLTPVDVGDLVVNQFGPEALSGATPMKPRKSPRDCWRPRRSCAPRAGTRL
jgi:hypothetical protein